MDGSPSAAPQRSTLTGWYETAKGAYVLAWERGQFDSAVEDIFGFNAAQISNIKGAYRLFYRSGLKLAEATEQLRALVPGQPELAPFVDFLAASERSIIR